jgi:hypothetical protein
MTGLAPAGALPLQAARFVANLRRSYWIPGAYAPALSEQRNLLLRLLKNKGFKEERMTKVESCAIGTSTTLESNKSPRSL